MPAFFCILLCSHNQFAEQGNTNNRINRSDDSRRDETSTEISNPQSNHHTPTDQVYVPWPQSRELGDQQVHPLHLSPKP
jgi:hypothetical protein